MQNKKFVLYGCDFVEQCVKSLRSLGSLENLLSSTEFEGQ